MRIFRHPHLPAILCAVLACSVSTRAQAPENKNYFRYERVDPADSKAFQLVPVPVKESEVSGSLKADRLIRSANDALLHGDLAVAKAGLDKAKTINPMQLGLWASFGRLAAKENNPAEAVADLQAELTRYPHQTILYPLLTGLLSQLSRRDDLERAYQAWLLAGTGNPFVGTMVMEMLIDDGDPKTAIQYGAAAIIPLTEANRQDVNFNLVLAQARMMAGGEVESHDFEELLHKLDRAKLNDIADDLAFSDVDLPLAERCSHESVAQFESISSLWIQESPAEPMEQTSRQIVAAWDTLGFVLLREDKLPESASYLRAAWHNAPDLDTGNHLGALQEKLGDKAEALSVYDTALTTVSQSKELEQGTNVAFEVKQLSAKADSLRKEVVSPIPRSPAQLLRSLYVSEVPNAEGLNGAGRYRLLLHDGVIEKVILETLSSGSDVSAVLVGMSFSQLFPTHSEASLVRSAQVECHSKICEIHLLP